MASVALVSIVIGNLADDLRIDGSIHRPFLAADAARFDTGIRNRPVCIVRLQFRTGISILACLPVVLVAGDLDLANG